MIIKKSLEIGNNLLTSLIIGIAKGRGAAGGAAKKVHAAKFKTSRPAFVRKILKTIFSRAGKDINPLPGAYSFIGQCRQRPHAGQDQRQGAEQRRERNGTSMCLFRYFQERKRNGTEYPPRVKSQNPGFVYWPG